MIISCGDRRPTRWGPLNATRRKQSYYVRREPTGDYAGYWETITDPDGNVRDRSGDREQYIDDMQSEVLLVSALPAGRILDVGCGLGWFLSAIPDDWAKFGTEVCCGAESHCRSQGVTMLNPSLDCAGVDADVVMCHHVIEHVDDPVDLICQIRRHMVPGGLLIIGTPDFGSPCAARFGERYRMLHDPTHVSLFTTESLMRMLRDHGFTIDAVRYPFPERYATPEIFARWNDRKGISPPWPGNWVTIYATR